MKLFLQSAAVTVLILTLALGAFAGQRIADWGSINTQTGDKAEF